MTENGPKKFFKDANGTVAVDREQEASSRVESVMLALENSLKDKLEEAEKVMLEAKHSA